MYVLIPFFAITEFYLCNLESKLYYIKPTVSLLATPLILSSLLDTDGKLLS